MQPLTTGPSRGLTDAARGPFVGAALLCERVLCETDGALSAIRILHEGPVVADGRPIHVVLLLVLVRGEVGAGQHRARLQIRDPSDQLVSGKDIALALDDGGPEQASSLVLDVSFEPRIPGVYWFQVSWGDDERLLTRVPFTARPAWPEDAGRGQGDHPHARR
jgi:hypothetical protein